MVSDCVHGVGVVPMIEWSIMLSIILAIFVLLFAALVGAGIKSYWWFQ